MFCWPTHRYMRVTKGTTHTSCCIYTLLPPDDGKLASPKHVEVYWLNKLKINSAPNWFLCTQVLENEKAANRKCRTNFWQNMYVDPVDITMSCLQTVNTGRRINFVEDFRIQIFRQRNGTTNDKKQTIFIFFLKYKPQPRMRVIIIPHSLVRLALVQCSLPYCLLHSPPLIAAWLWYFMV
jgi:hypothetical protein